MTGIVRLLLVLAVLAALVSGEQYVESVGYDRRDAEAVVEAKTQSDTATALRERLRTEKTEHAEALAALTKQMEKARDQSQTKNTTDIARRLDGAGLHYSTAKSADTGCRSGGTKDSAPGTANDAGTADVQLPRRINDGLFKLLGAAESLKIDYGVLYTYIHNPKLVCELVP